MKLAPWLMDNTNLQIKFICRQNLKKKQFLEDQWGLGLGQQGRWGPFLSLVYMHADSVFLHACQVLKQTEQHYFFYLDNISLFWVQKPAFNLLMFSLCMYRKTNVQLDIEDLLPCLSVEKHIPEVIKRQNRISEKKSKMLVHNENSCKTCFNPNKQA